MLPTDIKSELGQIADRVAALLSTMTAQEATSTLLLINKEIAQRQSKVDLAALDLLKPFPIPPEIIEEAKRTFNEKELLEEIQEVRSSGGLKLEDFLPGLEKLAHTGRIVPEE
jgi:hypothetical protein